MAADSELGAEPPASSAAPASVTVRPELRASAATSSVTYSGLPAAPSASRSRLSSGLPPARAATRSATAAPVSPVSWSRAASSTTRRSASRSSRWGTGRIIPTSSSGTCRADLASRPHRVTLAWSAHCRSSTTRMVGRTAHCSATSASNCSASTAGTSVPRSAATSPRKQPDDRVPPRIGGGLADPQPVEERQQRQRLAQLVTGPPEHLAAGLRRPRHRRPHQRGLADARLALDEHRTAAPPGHLLYQPGQQRHLAIAADQRTGRGHRVHGDKLYYQNIYGTSGLIFGH